MNNLIPKTIHYCWFGGNPIPQSAKKCMESWRKYCPDYEIKVWTEKNFNIEACPIYVRQAYEMKKWAFVTDFVRLKVVYEHGGIYLDTDVEIIDSLDKFLQYNAYFGFEDSTFVATGLGFGAVKGCSVLQEMMKDYQDIPFRHEDGSCDLLPCPQRNTAVLVRHGLIQNGTEQMLDGNIRILASDFLCPLDYYTGTLSKTKNTISIHWYSASWQTNQQREKHKKDVQMARRNNRCHLIRTIPNRMLKLVLGEERYTIIKKRYKNRG